MNFALGMQLQQSSFEQLAPEVQQQLIALANTQDERQYDLHVKSLENSGSIETKRIESSDTGRKQVLITSVILGGALLLIGTGISYLLIGAEQYQVAEMVIVSAITAVGGFLGGLERARFYASSAIVPDSRGHTTRPSVVYQFEN